MIYQQPSEKRASQIIKIKKGREKTEISTYILTFNQLHIPKEVTVGYCIKRVKQYFPDPLRCFKCQKYGHYREACRGRHTCVKCDEKGPNHMGEDCLKEIKCLQCRPGLCKILQNLQKERNTWGETQEECVIPGSKKNSRDLLGRK